MNDHTPRRPRPALWRAAAALLLLTAAAGAAESNSGRVRDVAVVAHDGEKLVLSAHLEVTAPRGGHFWVCYQARLADGTILKKAGDKHLILSQELSLVPNKERWDLLGQRLTFPLRELAEAVNLPKGKESVVWLDCSIYDSEKKAYITKDFDVSAPLLVTADGAGRVTTVDPVGVWVTLIGTGVEDRKAALEQLRRSTAKTRFLVAVLGERVAESPFTHRRALELLTDLLKEGVEARGVTAVLFAALDRHEEPERTKEGHTIANAIRESINPRCRDAVPALTEAVKDKRGFVRGTAYDALAKLGAAARDAVPALIEIAGRKDGKDGVSAITVLGRIGPDARAAVPFLTEGLKATDAEVRSASALALWRVARSEAALRTLIEGLAAPDKKDRERAAAALGEVGPEGKAAVPALVKALKDGDEIWLPAAEALAGFGDAGVPGLLRALKECPTRQRRNVLWIIERMGPRAKDAVPTLVELLRDANAQSRYAAANALGAIGQAAKEAVPTLTEALKDRDEVMVKCAAAALRKIDPEEAKRLGLR